MKFLKTTIYLSILFFLFGMAVDVEAASVFYSVGQTAADLKTGSPTVTIASGVATFSVAQTGNVGVGDRVTYNTTSVAYIASKTSTTVWNLVTATGGTPGNVTAQTVNSITREYTSLSAAEAGASDANHLNTVDLTSGGGFVLNLPCYYDTGADTTEVTVDGWTTGAANYIKIYTPNNILTEANLSQRHGGRWNDEKYSLVVTPGSYNSGIRVLDDFVTIDGLQIHVTTTGTQEFVSGISSNNVTDGSNQLDVSNCIIKGSLSSTGAFQSGIADYSFYSRLLVRNNVVYDFSGGGTGGVGMYHNTTAASYFYNNTIYNCYKGMVSDGALIAKNNLAAACVNLCYSSVGFAAGSTNNASSDASADDDVDMANPYINKTFSFVNELNDDFHLAFSDTSAKNMGADLSADANLPITTDIDGHTRPTQSVFDIGADEATTPIFYSVGQNTTDHKTGSPTLTIASGIGTFSVAQTANNMGVGDKVTYNTSTVAYISQKISTTQWKLTTATGGVAADITDSAVVSIAHAFASLSAAEAGAPGASYLNTSDLVTGNFQLNLPCYYDTGEDTATVAISGWTTGPLNYIYIYTPSDTSREVNQSQRHSGKWDDNGYVLHDNDSASSGISVGEDYVWIDGLQIKVTATGTNNRYGISFVSTTAGNNDLRFSNLIIRGVSSSTGFVAGMYGDAGTPIVTVWNSLVYDFVNGTDDSQFGLRFSGTTDIYNSTVYNCYSGGIVRSSGTITVKNTAVFASSNDFSGTMTIDRCASDDGDGTNAVIPADWSAVFVDYVNKDFHLKATDTSLREAGIADPGSGLFFDDIDGQHRSGGPDGTPWDIGADEYVGTIVGSPDLPGGSRMKINMSLTNKMTDGLVGMWSFDGANMDWSQATAEARDTSGNANHGDVSGATVAIGKRGQALSFDGTTSYVNAGSAATLDNIEMQGGGGMTVSAWVYALSYGESNNGNIVSKGSYNNMSGSWQLMFSGAAEWVMFAKDYDGASDLRVFVSYPSAYFNLWKHVVVTWDGSSSSDNTHIYIDGVEAAKASSNNGDGNKQSDSANFLAVGAADNYGAGETSFDGKLDEVRVYNRALSVSEIGDLYRLGQARIRK